MRQSCLASLTLIAATASAQQLQWQQATPSGRSYAGICFDPINKVGVMVGGQGVHAAVEDAWQWNGLRWSERFDTGLPILLASPSLVYDTARSRLVIVDVSGTWANTGSTWTRINSSIPNLTDGAVAYDIARDRIIHFGGTDGLPRNRLVEFNGSVWNNVSVAVAPAGRYFHAMAYDPTRQVTVVHGGTAYSSALGYYSATDTWEWNGTTWAQRVTNGPSGHPVGMVYDPTRQAMIMVMQLAPNSQTWSWNGTEWRLLDSNLPQSLRGMRMFFDENRGQIVAFGGGDGDNYHETRTLAFTTSGWVDVDRVPLPRIAPQMVFDEHRGVTLLFSGVSQAGFLLNESFVWEWDGERWSTRDLPGGPGGQAWGHWVYDPSRQACLWIDVRTPMRIWKYDGVTWTQLPSMNPPTYGFGNPDAAFDRVRNKIVFAAPNNTANTIDLWEWDSAEWVKRQPTVTPPWLQFSTLEFDQSRAVTTLFNSYVTVGWDWDGSNWTRRSPTANPDNYALFAQAYHTGLGNIVRFGGFTITQGLTNNLWRWNGSAWTAIPLARRPRERSSFGMTYDTWRDKVIVWGGASGTSGSGLTDLWQLGPACQTPVITSQPDNISVCSGSPATFSLTATFGGATASYAWYRGTTRLNVFTNPSAASPMLTLASATAADAGVYTCVIRTPCGTTTSPPRTLTISGPCCDSIDFNRNAVFPEEQDVIDLFAVYAGGPCPYAPPCDIDFNNNQNFPEDQDIIDFFTVLAGGECP